MVAREQVLNVDGQRNRVTLTLKKSLIDTELPVLTKLEDAKIGLVTPGVVAKILPKSLVINYFGGLRGTVALREARYVLCSDAELLALSSLVSEERLQSIEGTFNIGQVVRTLILSIDTSSASPRIVASIRQAVPNYIPPEDIPLGKAAAKERRDGDTPRIDFNALKEGDVVKGRVTAHTLKHGLGCAVRISSSVVGTLHPTDAVDDLKKSFRTSYPPPIDAVLDFAIVSIDRRRKRLVLSTRPSRVKRIGTEVVDPEIAGIGDLKRGQSVRGIVKSIADAGLFVSLGRSIDARAQIKELFDDVRCGVTLFMYIGLLRFQFVKDWKARFCVHNVVEAKVLK